MAMRRAPQALSRGAIQEGFTTGESDGERKYPTADESAKAFGTPQIRDKVRVTAGTYGGDNHNPKAIVTKVTPSTVCVFCCFLLFPDVS